MKMKRILILFMLSIFFTSNLLLAQEDETRIGVGVSIGKEIRVMDGVVITLSDFPSFYVPIILSPHFRLEPEIGLHRYSGSYDTWQKSSMILTVGCGIFPMTRKNKVDIYYGARLGLALSTRSYEYTNVEFDNVKESKLDFYIGPSVGGEYFFTENLSLGGEIQLDFVFLGQWDNEDDAVSETEIRSKTLIFVRFYF